MKYYLFLLLFSLVSVYSFSQSSPRTSDQRSNTHDVDRVDRGATYIFEKKKTKKQRSKHSISRQLDKKVKEYEKRMQANAKKYAKMEKEMKKPQYSDPTYFGHKKKPKKRPPGKKKFCKECQMVH